MAADLESFGHLTIARRESGEPVRVVRSAEEMVFLAFDTQIGRLVELHVLSGSSPLQGTSRRVAMERAQQATKLKAASFMNILEVGEDQGLVYYTSNLNDGESLDAYILRRGALPPATVYALLLNLLNDLTGEQKRRAPNLQMQLDRVMITAVEDTFLQLRVCDFGLSLPDQDEENASGQVQQVSELLFLMLTGQPYSGENPDRYPTMTSLPGNLRTTVRAALTDRGNAPNSLERLRDDIKEAHSAQVSSIQTRTARKQLLATTTLQPLSQLQSILLDGVSVEKILGNRFRIAEEDSTRQYPFAIPCLNVKNDQPITVHLLPPSRLIEKSQYEAVPLQSWRFSPEKHPHILRSLSLWESNEWSFLTEEREPGFTLSRLLTDRLTLNPGEVALLLRQIRTALDQAQECSVEKLDLHPSNIFLRVGKGGALQSRELDRLLQKRIDAWPPFLVKLRAHLTMRHLYEAPLVEPPASTAYEGEHQKDREHKNRSFVALAAYLLTGERNPQQASAFPETTPEPLSLYIRQTLEIANHNGDTPSPSEFLQSFESALAAPTTGDLATRLRGSTVAIEEMESVGSVSDFDDDDQAINDFEEISPISRRLHAHEFDHNAKKRSSALPVWAAAAVVILGMLAWFFSSNPSQVESETTGFSIPSLPKEPATAAEITPTAPTEVTSTTSAASPAPVDVSAKVSPPQTDANPKPAAPSKPVVVAVEPPKVEIPKAEPPKVIVSAPPPAKEKPNAPATTMPMTPPPPVTVPNPVIIRKAIMPSAEEIAKFKQGQVKPQPEPQPVQVTPTAPNQLNESKPVIKITSSETAGGSGAQ